MNAYVPRSSLALLKQLQESRPEQFRTWHSCRAMTRCVKWFLHLTRWDAYFSCRSLKDLPPVIQKNWLTRQPILWELPLYYHKGTKFLLQEMRRSPKRLAWTTGLARLKVQSGEGVFKIRSMLSNFKNSNVSFPRIHFKYSFEQRSKKRKQCEDDNMIRAQWLITIGQKWHRSDDIELKNRIEIVQR